MSAMANLYSAMVSDVVGGTKFNIGDGQFVIGDDEIIIRDSKFVLRNGSSHYRVW